MRLFLLPFLLLLIPACSSGSTETPADAEATIQPGAKFEVTEGDLAGVAVDVPADAAPAPVRLTATRAFAEAVPGFRPRGLGVALAPATPFRLPVLVTIPFAAGSWSGSEFVILQRSASGELLEMPIGDLDTTRGLATFATLELGTCWVAERLFVGLGTEEFLTINDGDRWEFAEDVSLTTTMEFGEPNLPFTNRLQLATPTDELAWYIDRHWSGMTELLGSTTTRGTGWQRLHDRERLLPGRVTLGQPTVTTFVADAYEPRGATTATGRVVTRIRVVADQPTRLVTPVDTYTDLLRLVLTFDEFEVTGARRSSRTLAITFQRYFGPVAIEIDGTRHLLTGGVVNGLPIGS